MSLDWNIASGTASHVQRALPQGLIFAFLAIWAMGCQQSEELEQFNISVGHQALTAEQFRILGFEAPTSDWSSSASLSANSTASQGGSALAVELTGYTQIVSVPMSSLGVVQPDVSLDVRLPDTVHWGDVRVILQAPSLGLWWEDLGGHSLAGLSPGDYHTLHFSIPSHALSALSGIYSDLQVRVTVNGPNLGAPYLIDNLVLAEEGVDTDVDTDVTPDTRTLTLMRPTEVALGTLMLSAAESIKVDDGVTLGKGWEADIPRGYFNVDVPPKIVDVASFGAPRDEYGADVIGFTNVYSKSDVAFLRSKSHILGFLKTEGTVEQQDNVHVDGGIFTGETVTPVEIPLEVELPTGSMQEVHLEPDEVRYLEPGAYGALNVKSRADLVLKSGTYYFQSFNTEPEALVWLARTNGPVNIYIEESFTYKGAFKSAGGKPEELLVGYFGESAAYIQAPMTGTIIAPNAKVELRRPLFEHHRCSVFAKEIQVFSNALVEHLPFPWNEVICEDTDEDGVSDCEDLCPINPDKADPGICGCRVAEDDDDNDKAPNCIDLCPNDPNKTYPGDCGCADDAAANVGKACNDGPCVGHGVCTEDGTCDIGDSCEPDDNCFYTEFKMSGYWICDAPSTWQEAFEKCQAEPGRTLVQLNTRIEDKFLSDTIAAKGISDALWMGANESGEPNIWRWSNFENEHGTAFWQGGPDGSRVRYRYEKWTSGEPDEGSCGSMTPGTGGSAWNAEDCGITYGYICEGPAGRARLDEPYREPAHPGTPQDDPVDCESPASQFGSDPDMFAANANSCMNNCQDDGSGCDDCSLGLTPLSGDELDNRCRQPNALAEPCILGSVPDPNNLDSCADGSSCSGDTVCGIYYPAKRCDGPDCTLDPNGDFSGKLVCGYPPVDAINGESLCAAWDPDEPCLDVDVCHSNEAEGGEVDPLVLTPAGLAEEIVTPEIMGDSGSESPTMPLDPPCDDPTPEGQCLNGFEHNWCHYDFANNGIGEKPDGRTKNGSSGENLISFDFDPNLNWYYNAEPGPLGVAKFDLNASAHFVATASFHVSDALQGSVEVVNIGGGVNASLCSFSTDLHAILLGQDFTEIILPDYENVQPKSPEEIAACEEALANFQLSADQAKKAMRDAQELMRQYRDLKSEGKQFDNLCAEIGNYPGEFSLNCNAVGNEGTIDAFINYYEKKYNDIDELRANLANSIVTTGGVLPINLFDSPYEEQQNLLTMNFLIGPLPALLEVNAILSYGITGGLELDLKGAFPTGYEKEELASVMANITPNAEASVSLFVGAGFSACGFSASVGVEGRVNIATVEAPFNAMAGISIQGIPDERTVPDDNVMPGEGRPYDYPSKFLFLTDYGFGSSVVVSDMLRGDISLRLKIKFAFFSKTWRKRIMSFDGIGGFTIPLLSVSDEIAAAAFDDAAWGFSEMGIRFLDLRAAWQDIQAEEWINGTDNGVENFDTDRVQTLFYDQLCRDCIPANQPCVPDDQKLPTDASCCPGFSCTRQLGFEIVGPGDDNVPGNWDDDINVFYYDPVCTEIPEPEEIR